MPRHVYFWDALPKSAVGKVPKQLVKDELKRRGLAQPVEVDHAQH